MAITKVQLKEVLTMLQGKKDFFMNQMSLYHNSDQHKCYKKNIAYYEKEIAKLSKKIADYRA